MNEQNQPGGSWQYQPGNNDQVSQTPETDSQVQSFKTKFPDGAASRSISWSASEFIAHEKNITWYLALGAITVVGAGLAFFLSSGDYITTFFIAMAGLIFGLEAKRKPKQITYTVDDHGVTIGQKFLSYANFRSFTVVDDGAFPTINFLPLKRFAVVVSAYVDPADEPAVMEIPSTNLPIEDGGHDIIERLMRRIRF